MDHLQAVNIWQISIPLIPSSWILTSCLWFHTGRLATKSPETIHRIRIGCRAFLLRSRSGRCMVCARPQLPIYCKEDSLLADSTVREYDSIRQAESVRNGEYDAPEKLSRMHEGLSAPITQQHWCVGWSPIAVPSNPRGVFGKVWEEGRRRQTWPRAKVPRLGGGIWAGRKAAQRQKVGRRGPPAC